MTKKIFRSIVLAVTAVLIISFSVVTVVLYNHFSQTYSTQLSNQLDFVSDGVELLGKDYLTSFQNETYRVTWINKDGTVLYDTQADINSMDNHKGREEISEAFSVGVGESERYSDTLMLKMLYRAEKLSDGTVLRISSTKESVFALMIDVLIPMVFIMVFSIILSSLFARHLAKSIIKPLNTIDLENPTENDIYDELTPMLTKISKQHNQISKHMVELQKRADELEQIMTSMNEGLVLLDRHGSVISMNSAAQKLFGVVGDVTGHNFLFVDRNIKMNRCVEKALQGTHSEFREQRNGNEYQFGVNAIKSGGKIIGVVIISFDITETAFAERNRQEFTANVSHELKTPLQSIIGSAELLENGLVKPEDTNRFISNIRKEASRLVTLINDIIRLSQLDENKELLTEDVNLYNIANEVKSILLPLAVDKNIDLSVTGENIMLKGVRRYLYEIIYNLCDNSIRYTEDGGKVRVDISSENDKTILTVSDNGIGIPVEHQSRIFERFYRVDKSHSKETGGTGLGLSIVKHAVNCHGGTIKLDSTVGKGTTIKIIF